MELCMATPCWCPSERHQYDGWKPTETSVTEFCGYENVNSSVEVLINIKVIFFAQYTNCLYSHPPK